MKKPQCHHCLKKSNKRYMVQFHNFMLCEECLDLAKLILSNEKLKKLMTASND